MPIFAAAIVSVALLSGCAADSDGGDGGDVTLTIASYHWLEEGRGDVMWEVLEQYTEENPHVTLKQQTSNRAEYDKSLSTQIGAGGGPDILHMPDPFFVQLRDAGALVPLDGVLDESASANLTPKNSFYVGEDGSPYAYVWESAGYGFFYNKDLLEEAGVEVPTSFDDLVTAAQLVKERLGITGVATRHLMNEEAAWFSDHLAWPYGTGGGWSDGSELTINSPENIQAETYFKQLYDSGAFAVGDDSATFRDKFKQGQIAMLIDAAGTMVSITKDNDVVPASSVGSSSIPFPSQGTQALGGGLAINANSENVEEAKNFLNWMYQPEIQEQLAEGMFPSIVGTTVDVPEHLRGEYPWFDNIYELMISENARPIVIEGFEEQTPAIRTIILTQIERMLTQGVDPKDALDQAQTEAEKLVGQ